jgi:hypothetical protein
MRRATARTGRLALARTGSRAGAGDHGERTRPGTVVAVVEKKGKGSWCRRLAQVSGVRGHLGAGSARADRRGGRYRGRERSGVITE